MNACCRSSLRCAVVLKTVFVFAVRPWELALALAQGLEDLSGVAHEWRVASRCESRIVSSWLPSLANGAQVADRGVEVGAAAPERD